MPSYEYKKDNNIMDDSSVTGDVYSEVIFPRSSRGFSLTYSWNSSGNLVAALYLQCRNDEDESWTTCNNASFPSSPDGSSGNDEYSVEGTNHAQYRVFCDFTSGDGELVINLNHAK
jgi:hypothetical protein